MAITREPSIWETGFDIVTYTGEDHRARMRQQAAKFIAAKAHKGNHGFTGKALTAWRTQRKAILDALRPVAKTGKGHALHTKGCPVDVAADAYWEAKSKGKKTKMQGGTKAGVNWVENAQDCIDRAHKDESYGSARTRRS